MNPLCLTSLEPGEIHLWLVRLDAGPDIVETLLPCLSTDERVRADRLRIRKVRDYFIVARGVLRKILGGYLCIPPNTVSFVYGPHGKPELNPEDHSDLFFNLSHSGDLGLLAVNRTCPIGADIERTRGDRHFLKLAERFFSAREFAELRSLPAEDLVQGFYSCWTRKEAYLKAIGTGLATPLNAFDVSLKPDERAALVAQRLDPSEPERWDIRDIDVPAGYRAAVVTGWKSPAIIIREWHEAC